MEYLVYLMRIMQLRVSTLILTTESVQQIKLMIKYLESLGLIPEINFMELKSRYIDIIYSVSPNHSDIQTGSSSIVFFNKLTFASFNMS